MHKSNMKAQGSFGVMMYSIVIIWQSSTEWISAFKYISYSAFEESLLNIKRSTSIMISFFSLSCPFRILDYMRVLYHNVTCVFLYHNHLLLDLLTVVPCSLISSIASLSHRALTPLLTCLFILSGVICLLMYSFQSTKWMCLISNLKKIYICTLTKAGIVNLVLSVVREILFFLFSFFFKCDNINVCIVLCMYLVHIRYSMYI